MINNRLGIVLLGAGNSKRFGGRKQFQIVDGEEMYLKTAKKFSNISDKKVFVTQFEEMKEQINALGYQMALNPYPEWGISYSIQQGIKTLGQMDSKVQAILFAVCDQPLLSEYSIEKMVNVYEQNPEKIICLSWQGQLGNPVIFPISYQEELIKLQGDVGGKRIVRQHLEETILVEAKREIELFDIDKKEDLEKLNHI